jgi:hypothetical protein
MAVLQENPAAPRLKGHPMPTTPNRARRLLLSAAAVGGLSLGAAGVASAATASSTPTSSSSSASSSAAPTQPPKGAPSGAIDPSTVAHGPNETLLTGTDLASATAAAQAAEPGATIIRVETDSSGDATYEAHMKKADGTFVTVELDSSFKVTSTKSGFGPGPAGAPAPQGAPASGATGSSSTSN